MASVFPAIIAERFDERWYFQSINVIPSALALRFEHVTPSLVRVRSNANGVLTIRCVVERIDGSKSFTYAVDVCSGRGR